MRNLLIFLLVLCRSVYCFGAAKTPVVPDEQYHTIQQAINAAEPGDKIKVKPGVYTEMLTFKEGIDLEGTDQNTVVIRCDANRGSVIKVNGCSSGFIHNLTLEHIDKENSQDSDSPIILLNSSSIRISGCTIQNSSGNGITIRGKGNCEVSDCIIQNNTLNGITVHMESVLPLIRNNQCVNNGGNGILFAEGSCGNAEKNICCNNSYNGISIMSAMASAKLTNNLCSNNNGSGIWVGDGARCQAQSNLCNNNKWHGISIADSKSVAVLNDNQCSSNQRCGIYYSGKINEDDSGNILTDNGEFNDYQIRCDFWDEKFDELEQTVSKIRREKRRYSNGNWQLNYFYDSLGNWSRSRSSGEEITLGILNNWIKAVPDSVTPYIIKASVYESYAWHARGHGYADTVSEENRKIFKEKLGKAWEVLQEAEKISKNDDPELYRIFFGVGRCLGKDDNELGYLFENGVAIERGYFPIYRTRANFLLPRWGGETGDVEKFAQYAEEISKDTNEFIYARIAASMVCMYKDNQYNEFLELDFSYPMIKEGHIALLKKYPQVNYYLNTYCLLASLYKDRETAKELFNKIGDNWDSSVWHKNKEKVFQKYKDWAFDTKTEQASKETENPQQTSKTSYIRRWLQKFTN